MRPHPIAIIDLGSNTVRVVVFRFEREGTFRVVADDKVSLQLIRRIDARGMLTAEACARTLRVLADFRRIAAGAGARKILAVATAALREAHNGPEFLARAQRATGMPIRLLSPEAEARCAFLGAAYGMAVDHGQVLDIGGGSLQIATFRDRMLRTTWSLPLGALRSGDRFLRSDPPSKQQLRRLRDHAARLLAKAEVPELEDDEVLIGTGGTIRNLAKIDARLRGYPITRLHGYVLTAGRTRSMTSLLCARKTEARNEIPGLNVSRADSIVGGGLLVQVFMEHAGAGRMLVAGLGLREGLVLDALNICLPNPAAVSTSAVRSLVSRFASWDAERAARRKKIVDRLAAALLRSGSVFQRDMTSLAATVLDIGRGVEYYRRHEHSSMILRSAGLDGFSHREILYLSLIIKMAGSLDWHGKDYSPLLRNGDLEEISRAAVVLSLADEIEHRIPARRVPRLRCRVLGGSVLVSEPCLASWEPAGLAAAFLRSFGKKLRISG